MRYCVSLAYNGSSYAGWQRQPNANSVQEQLEAGFTTILRQDIELTGCGRTDTGVHADCYYAHFDGPATLPEALVYRLNRLLPDDIAIRDVMPVADDFHARFDAYYRAYRYELSLVKNPFRGETITHYPVAARADREQMQAAARLLLDYDDFMPFCKTGADNVTTRCQLHRSEWEFDGEQWNYHIAANRFLRGMVRLCVGMCLNVGLGKLQLQDVRRAMDNQHRLAKSQSAPPHGLFLTEVRYPAGKLPPGGA